MIKKHLITCSVIFVLVIISKFFIDSATAGTAVKKVETNERQSSSIFLFERIVNHNYSFADEALPSGNSKVKRKLKRSLWLHSFANTQSSILHRKALKLFPIIEPILRLYGIPEDFKYIPLVETGLCDGISPRGAAGVWQFMPQTARDYGLKVGNGKDDRMNVRKSTIAACKYLKELHQKFHNWTLTAAAYNGGSPRIRHAINRHNKGNYFTMHLNRETSMYVYKLIAMKEVISNPKEYGYKHIPYNPIQPAEYLASLN